MSSAGHDTFSVRLADGAGFSADGDDDLLSAAQRAHWLVRYGCRNGNCEACAATLLDGRVRQRDSVIAATAAAPAQILLCLCRAESDLTIALPGNPQHGSADQARRSYARISACREIAPGLWHWQFALPAGRRPPVYAGQYLELETAQGRVRADIDSAASQGRELHAFAAIQADSAGASHFYIRYPLGYCYAAAPVAPVLILHDANRSVQARQLHTALAGAEIVAVDAGVPAPAASAYDTVLACCADSSKTRYWFEQLLARGVTFREFRSDSGIWQAWRVRRQDDNGNRFTVAGALTEDAARQLAAQMEQRGHKQLYWAEPMAAQ